MIAKQEIWDYSAESHIWAGKYRNSQNLPHWHFDCELIFVEKGSIDVFCEKKKHTLLPGNALFVDSGQVHHMHAMEQDTVLIVIVFNYHILQPLAGDFQLADPLLYGSYPIAQTYAELKRILTERQKFFDAEATFALGRLLVEIFRGELLVKKIPDKTILSFKELLGDIAEKYRYYTFEDAVAFMGMSPAYFSRYFRKITGVTFSQYLNFVRIDNAVRILRSGQELSVTDLADLCGFSTVRNFNRIFSEITGYPPTRLPAGFMLEEQISYPSAEAFNPTRFDCELIESTGGNIPTQRTDGAIASRP